MLQPHSLNSVIIQTEKCKLAEDIHNKSVEILISHAPTNTINNVAKSDLEQQQTSAWQGSVQVEAANYNMMQMACKQAAVLLYISCMHCAVHSRVLLQEYVIHKITTVKMC